MALSSALSIAQNSLLNTQRQTNVVSRNIANAYNPDYARRTAVLSSVSSGAQISIISRATDIALRQQTLSAMSGFKAQDTIVKSLDWLALSINGANNASSPATLVGKLQEAVQLYSGNPANRTIGEAAVEAARDVLRTLNDGAAAIQTYRAETDRQITTAVNEVNALLAEFKSENDRIVNGTIGGREVLDAVDRRDAILKQISEYIPISTIGRANNDLMIVTADGTTLFETIPRNVHFEPVPAYGPATAGNNIFVDGVPISASYSANTTASGTLAAMVQVRDSIAVTAQTYLDEIARGLIVSFSETDPGNPADTRPGLFTWPGAPAMPADATLEVGLASRISLNALIDPLQGGDPTALRDGANFDFNPDDNASFTDHLIRFASALDTPLDFVNGANVSVMGFSSSAINWIDNERKSAATAAEIKSALMLRTEEALSNVTRVNVDEEMALMLELEQSYAASAKMMQMIDEMLRQLLSIVR